MNIRYEKMDAWQDQARTFFKDHWQTDTMVVSSGEYRLADLTASSPSLKPMKWWA